MKNWERPECGRTNSGSMILCVCGYLDDSGVHKEEASVSPIPAVHQNSTNIVPGVKANPGEIKPRPPFLRTSISESWFKLSTWQAGYTRWLVLLLIGICYYQGTTDGLWFIALVAIAFAFRLELPFDYRVYDDHRGVVDGRLEFDILPVNDPVETVKDILVTMENQSVKVPVDQLLANDRDVDGSTITFVALGRSANGSAVLAADNTVVFTPDGDYAGEAAGFEYLVQDSEGLKSVGRVQVRVSNVNDVLEIIAQSLSLTEDVPLIFNAATLSRFVRDVDNDTLTFTGVAAVTGGTVAEADSDKGLLMVTPHERRYADLEQNHCPIGSGRMITAPSVNSSSVLTFGRPDRLFRSVRVSFQDWREAPCHC